MSFDAPPSVNQEADWADKAGGIFVPPDKSWSFTYRSRPGWAIRVWNWAGSIVGGTGRLKGILLSLVAVMVFAYWWQLPPAPRTVQQEFSSCRAVLKRLQDRRVGRSEWEFANERYRPRIQQLVNRLKAWATDRYPIQQALYRAGAFGLIPMFDNPIAYVDADREYERQMEIVRRQLDSRTSQPAGTSGK